jgi:hypothetical protein
VITTTFHTELKLKLKLKETKIHEYFRRS